MNTLDQRFPNPVLVAAPPHSAYLVCISYHVQRLFYSTLTAFNKKLEYGDMPIS